MGRLDCRAVTQDPTSAPETPTVERLKAFGYTPALAQALSGLPEAQPDWQAARIVRVERNQYLLETASGPREGVWPAGRRHKLLDVPVIGDWVACSGAADTPDEPLRIEAVLDRQNTFIRSVLKGRRTQPQVLAANVDTVLIVTSPLDWDLERLERYVQAVQLSQAQPVILLNKTDEVRSSLERWTDAGLDAPVLPISAAAGQGLDALAEWLAPGRTAALIGSSGVGKSTLTNALLGQELSRAGDVSDLTGEGRHTTTWRTLYPLPLDGPGRGALLIDNPGLRDIAVWDEEGAAFWAIEELAADCRYSRCTHGREPGCAVQAAVARGELDAALVDLYREQQAVQEAPRRNPRDKRRR